MVHGPGSSVRSRVAKSGIPGGTISERGTIRDDRLARLVGRLPQAIAARLLVALEGPVEHRDPLQPLDARHPVPAGHDQPQRESRAGAGAAGRSSRRPAAPPRAAPRPAGGCARIAAPRRPRPRGRAPRKSTSTAPSSTSRLLEQAAQRRAGPLGRAHRLEQPRLAQRPRRERGAAVSGALQRHRERHRRPGAEVVERQRQLARHAAVRRSAASRPGRPRGCRSGSAGSAGRPGVTS